MNTQGGQFTGYNRRIESEKQVEGPQCLHSCVILKNTGLL